MMTEQVLGGLRLTRLGLGMAALGRPAYITVGHSTDFADGRTHEAMRSQAHAVLDAALAHGIGYFDAARSYGDAEAFLRSWLDARRLLPGSVTIGSKWGYVYEAGWQLQAESHERKDHSLAALRRQFEESSSILGGHLALYQIHSATRESGVLEDDEVLNELARVRERGIRIGVTTSGPGQAEVIRRALSIRRDGVPLFASIQATWNLLERASEEALREAHDAGRTVLVKEALANGRLAARGDAGSSGEALEIARSRGLTPDAVALAATIAQPWADLVLLGASTVPQLESNTRALDITLTSAEIERLGAMRMSKEVYWRERARLPWN
jgi:aryl-alcohol dehydrogenase-like predicted oxidoreductase